MPKKPWDPKQTPRRPGDRRAPKDKSRFAPKPKPARPGIPEGVAILPPMLTGLSELNGTDKPVDQVMADMKTGVDDIMKKAGYPKPFPES